MAHPLLPGPDHPCPASGVPAAAVFLAKTLGKTFTTGAQLASHIRPAPPSPPDLARRSQASTPPTPATSASTRHVPLGFRLPQIGPCLQGVLPAQTQPRQTPGPSHPRPDPQTHPHPLRNTQKQHPPPPPTSPPTHHNRLTHHTGTPLSRRAAAECCSENFQTRLIITDQNDPEWATLKKRRVSQPRRAPLPPAPRHMHPGRNDTGKN